MVKIFEIFEEERRSEQLTKIPLTLYKDIANYIKNTRNGFDNNGKSIYSKVVNQEREMLADIIQRILELRVNKIIDGLADFDALNIPTEEKYIIEPLVTATKRLSKVGKAVSNGGCAFLEAISEKTSHKYSAVRFLKSSPPTMGADLARYGPFRAEDITFLPIENVKVLLKQGIVQELDIEI
ncbi:MAG: DNA replication complex GINS family protein [Thaumarchaeota archaeon]|nr:DNA replication complex GINS family protein [Nitrososphaerota archaeon]